MSTRLIAVAAFGALIAAAYTSQSDHQDAELAGAIAPEAVASAPTSSLNDPAIVAIFDAANTADIETGQLAAERGSTKVAPAFDAHRIAAANLRNKLGA